ncbi:B12-binding domain-containing radical SAM protein [Saccharothrix isguenensis]
MRLVYAPSARRIVPYPPVGIAVLAAQLGHAGLDATAYDLEMELAWERVLGESCLLYESGLDSDTVLREALDDEVAEYGAKLWRAIDGSADHDVAISVMGYEQVASALLLARVALSNGCRVVFGGQFFTPASANEVLTALLPFGVVTVVVGDGWDAVEAFARGASPDRIPNGVTATPRGPVAGPVVAAKSLPPQPDYSWVRWDRYELFGAATYRDSQPVRRAHLYVWDKQCNFRCAFCRVATGSRAVLTPPQTAVTSFEGLIGQGVRQLNFMTNELNPSRKYMLRFLDAMEEAGCVGSDWFTYVRADRLETDDLARMRAVGGRLARYGVESGSQRLLDLMRKDYHVPTMERTLHAAADVDIWNHVNFLIGFPGEEESDIDETIRFLDRNAANIHSVRINPFYLPPETPIARDPGAFGIELAGFDSGWWKYRNADGGEPDADAVVRRVKRVSEHCASLGIGFAGTDPFFLLDVISRYDRRDEALRYLQDEFSFFWVPAPTDAYKALIGGYEVRSDWKDIALKRQRNYALSLRGAGGSGRCTD